MQPTFPLAHWHSQLFSWISNSLCALTPKQPQSLPWLWPLWLPQPRQPWLSVAVQAASHLFWRRKFIINIHLIGFSMTVLTKGVKIHVMKVIRKRPKMQQNLIKAGNFLLRHYINVFLLPAGPVRSQVFYTYYYSLSGLINCNFWRSNLQIFKRAKNKYFLVSFYARLYFLCAILFLVIHVTMLKRRVKNKFRPNSETWVTSSGQYLSIYPPFFYCMKKETSIQIHLSATSYLSHTVPAQCAHLWLFKKMTTNDPSVSTVELKKEHGNEADFLRFLHKSVPHESLTLPFELFRFWLRIRRDIHNRKTTPRYILTHRVGESTRFSRVVLFFKLLNKSVVIVHYIPGFLFAKLVL